MKLQDLPQKAQTLLTSSYHLQAREQGLYQEAVVVAKNFTSSVFPEDRKITENKVKTDNIIFATDSYTEHKFKDNIVISMFEENIFIPRVEKHKDEQKKRTKTKAEVFTSSWICNMQNNLIDEAVLNYKNAFNKEDPKDRKKWIGSSKPVKFTDDYTWVNYVTEKRIEFTAGEAPYLISRYDTVSGDEIPVRNENKLFQRIGLLDRKLRVAFENTENVTDFKIAALYAFRATYGYEWQGDSLVLARLNFVNTYNDYIMDLYNVEATEEELIMIAEIASWNLWQMDGLKMVVPETCSSSCAACLKKTRGGHDGVLSAIRFGKKYKTFEELGPVDWFPNKIIQKQANSLF